MIRCEKTFTPFSETYVLKCGVILCSESKNRRAKRPHSLFLCRHARFLDTSKWHPRSKSCHGEEGSEKRVESSFIPGRQVPGYLDSLCSSRLSPLVKLWHRSLLPPSPGGMWWWWLLGLWSRVAWRWSRVSLGMWLAHSSFSIRKARKKKIVPSSSVCCVRLSYLIPAEHRDQEWDPVPLHTQSVDKHWVKNHGSWDLPLTSWWQECRFSSVVSQGVADGLDPIKSTGPCL